ncbi:MAG: LicD family protein [Bacteroidales bacterium]|nr:LicD family protein [Bacteroidales bacterium]
MKSKICKIALDTIIIITITMNLKYHVPPEFLQESVACDYTISAEMKKVWAVELDLLQELLRVCGKYNLRIYADGGTLLGAVRHKGFIPWDDDIDMMMFREDYDKLLSHADEFENPYFLQSVYTDKHYTHRHAQLRNSSTACWSVEDGHCFRRYNQGIFIDIFPADNMPMSPRQFNKHYLKERAARQKFRFVSKFTNVLSEKLYNFCRNSTKMLSDVRLYEKYEQVLRGVPFNALGYVCEISFRRHYPIIPVAYFGEPLWVDFEYIQIPIMQEAHKYLKVFYGDNYMTPLQLAAEHGRMCFDTEHSYLEHK